MSAITNGFIPVTGTVFETHATTTDFTGAVGSNSWTTQANVIDIKKLPSVTYDKIENTLLTDPTKHYEPGQGEPSDFEIECRHDIGTYTALLALKATDKSFRIKCVDATGIGWSGFIQNVQLNTPKGKAITITVKGQMSGDPSTISSD